MLIKEMKMRMQKIINLKSEIERQSAAFERSGYGTIVTDLDSAVGKIEDVLGLLEMAVDAPKKFEPKENCLACGTAQGSCECTDEDIKDATEAQE